MRKDGVSVVSSNENGESADRPQGWVVFIERRLREEGWTLEKNMGARINNGTEKDTIR
jgi:hypothetical protein